MSRPDEASAEPPPPAVPPPPAAPPAPEPVAEGVRCLRCGYELAGLGPAGDCPECGTAIARSLSEDRIVDADPQWLRRILTGLALLGWGPWAILIAILLTLLISVSLAAFGSLAASGVLPSEIDATAGVILVVAGIAIMAGVVAAAIGGLLVTTLEPRDEGRERLDEPRMIARWGLVVAVILPVALASIDQATPWPMPEFVRFAVLAVALASGGSALAALHARFRDFAVRIPSSALAERADRGRAWYRRMTIFVTILMVLLAAEELARGLPALGPLTTVLAVITGLGSCAAFVVFIVAFFRTFGVLDLALSLRSTIRQSIRDASPAPAAGPAPGHPTP